MSSFHMDAETNADSHCCQYAHSNLAIMYACMDMPADDKYKVALQALMDLRKLSQNELARVSGVAQPTISRILKGLQRPGQRTLYKLARGLKATSGQLLGEEPITEDDDLAVVARVMQDLPPYKLAMLRAAA